MNCGSGFSNIRITGSDVHGLDGDGDGIGCRSNEGTGTGPSNGGSSSSSGGEGGTGTAGIGVVKQINTAPTVDTLNQGEKYLDIEDIVFGFTPDGKARVCLVNEQTDRVQCQ